MHGNPGRSQDLNPDRSMNLVMLLEVGVHMGAYHAARGTDPGGSHPSPSSLVT